MPRIPADASPLLRQALEAIWRQIDKLGSSQGQNQDLRGRRVTNAGDAELEGDLVTFGQLQQMLGNAEAQAAARASTPGSGGGGGGGGGDYSDLDVHPDYSSYVQQAKDELVAAMVDLRGDCGAFEIVKRAAQLIQPVDATIGLFEKTDGSQCQGYSKDILAFVDGTKYDVLIGAGDGDGNTTGNTVTWSYKNEEPEPDRYRPPI